MAPVKGDSGVSTVVVVSSSQRCGAPASPLPAHAARGRPAGAFAQVRRSFQHYPLHGLLPGGQRAFHRVRVVREVVLSSRVRPPYLVVRITLTAPTCCGWPVVSWFRGSPLFSRTAVAPACCCRVECQSPRCCLRGPSMVCAVVAYPPTVPQRSSFGARSGKNRRPLYKLALVALMTRFM